MMYDEQLLPFRLLPSVDEKNLLYVIFLPPGSTLSTTDFFWGCHCPTGSPCPAFSKFNPSSSDNDLFWAVIPPTPGSPTIQVGNPGINIGSANDFATTTAYVVAHELGEAFTDRDGNGFVINMNSL